MAIIHAIKQHRKFEIIHDIERLYQTITEIVTPQGIYTEMDIEYRNIRYTVRIDAIRFLSDVEYQFRIGNLDCTGKIVTAIYADMETWDDFVAFLIDFL